MSTVTVIGLGTIGSALCPLVARMSGVTHITLVDPDAYTASNLANQAIDTSAPGKPKVEVQAALIHAIDPQIQVVAIAERVENVPLGRLDSSILVSCVDNRRARQSINGAAWRRGNPWIDAAVDAASLVRINAYEPGASSPCLECAWDDRSYDLLEQEYSCTGGEITVPATGTPVELGALAAALQAGELRRLLDDTAKDNSLVSAQLMLDTTTHTRHLSRFTHNEHCRFDHEIWKVETVALSPPDNTLADLFDAVDAGSDPSISLEGHAFATHVDCVACGRRSNVGLSLYGRLSDSDRTCSCSGRMFAPGFFSFAAIRRSDLSTVNLGLKLAALGFCDSDVISVANGSDKARHIEIGERVSR